MNSVSASEKTFSGTAGFGLKKNFQNGIRLLTVPPDLPYNPPRMGGGWLLRTVPVMRGAQE
jgi:hypothetical protein